MDCGKDYNSEFDSDAEETARRKKRQQQEGERPVSSHLPSHFKSDRGHVGHFRAHHSRASMDFDKEEASRQRQQFLALNAFDRHKKLVNDYLKFYGGKKSDFGRDSRFDKTDLDVIRENVKFVYEDDEQTSELADWNERIAKRYWDKLYKEYAIADLTYFKTGQVGMRWRTEQEVVTGKGQFICGNKFCQENSDLLSWEVNFAYKEQDNKKKNALVKLRLCPDCSFKLNFKKQHRKVSKPKSLKKTHNKKEKRVRGSSSESKLGKKKRKWREQDSDSDNSVNKSEEDREKVNDRLVEKCDQIVHKDANVWASKPEEKAAGDEELTVDEEIDNYFLDILA